MSKEAIFKLQIPPEILKFIDKNAPRDAKLMAAKGIVPMPPQILITALYMLMQDSDPEISSSASASLLKQPESVVRNLLSQPMHPKLIDFFAHHYQGKPEMLEIILLNRLTPDGTYVFLAPLVNERLLMIIAENQERMLRTTAIAEALRKNPNAPQSMLDRVISFLRMSGVILEGVAAELTDDEVQKLLAEDDHNLLETIFDANVDENIDDLSAILFDEDEEGEQKEELDVLEDKHVMRRLSTLTIAEKIKLALKGNKEVRTALIKDPNKLVCTAVIKSPKIQESEVISIAAMRSVNDEVLRIVARNPEWTKNYNLKYALVSNPKCPLAISLQFLKFMRVSELGLLAKNRNVSQQIQRIAKQLHAQNRK